MVTPGERLDLLELKMVEVLKRLERIENKLDIWDDVEEMCYGGTDNEDR